MNNKYNSQNFINTFNVAENHSHEKINFTIFKTFLLSVTAGGFISLAFVFYITVMIGSEMLPYGIAKLIGGICFSIGLILVSICKGELFTSSVLLFVSKLSGNITFYKMLKNWLIVYIGNIFGALLFVFLIFLAKLHMTADGLWGINVLKIAKYKLSHGFSQAIVLGLLCNMLVCLSIWMTYACKTVGEKCIVILFPITMFVACGFEHSIANTFLIPLAIVIQLNADVSFWSLNDIDSLRFSSITLNDFIFQNLLPVTIGNIIGGAGCVGTTYWLINKN